MSFRIVLNDHMLIISIKLKVIGGISDRITEPRFKDHHRNLIDS